MKTTNPISEGTKPESVNITPIKWTENNIVMGLITEPKIKIKAAEIYHELYFKCCFNVTRSILVTSIFSVSKFVLDKKSKEHTGELF